MCFENAERLKFRLLKEIKEFWATASMDLKNYERTVFKKNHKKPVFSGLILKYF